MWAVLIRKCTKSYRKICGSLRNIFTRMGHQWFKGNSKVECPHQKDGDHRDLVWQWHKKSDTNSLREWTKNGQKVCDKRVRQLDRKQIVWDGIKHLK